MANTLPTTGLGRVACSDPSGTTSRRRRPVATILLIAINVAVFLLVQSPLRGTDVVRIQTGTVRIDSELRFDLEYAAIPCELTQGRPLTINEIGTTFVQGDTSACDHNDNSRRSLGRTSTAVIPRSWLLWRMAAPWLQHAVLWVFGNNVGDRLGWALYLLFYVLAGIFAFFSRVVLLNPEQHRAIIGAGRDHAGDGRTSVWFPGESLRCFLISCGSMR
jgi:hypothetical protein